MSSSVQGFGAAVREPNAVDFWRGFALIAIFINHVGLVFSRYLPASVSISDSADLFVFLAGWALRLVTNGRSAAGNGVYRKLSRRVLQIYRVHLLTLAVFVAMFVLAAFVTGNKTFHDWHGLPVFFADPLKGALGMMMLTYQPAYLNILPLYVVVMALAMGYVALDRRAPALVLPVALVVYVATLALRIETPHWPTPDNWLLHPLAWQLTFVLGFVLASPKGIGGWARANIGVLRIAAIPMLVLGYLVARQGWLNGLINENPDWPLLLGLSKHYDAPLRVLHLLSLLAVGSLLYPWIARFAPLVVRYFCMLGRHSLNVFAASLLLSIAAQIVRSSLVATVPIDTVTLALGLIVSGLVAAWSESTRVRERALAVGSSPA